MGLPLMDIEKGEGRESIVQAMAVVERKRRWRSICMFDSVSDRLGADETNGAWSDGGGGCRGCLGGVECKNKWPPQRDVMLVQARSLNRVWRCDSMRHGTEPSDWTILFAAKGCAGRLRLSNSCIQHTPCHQFCSGLRRNHPRK